VRWTYGKAEWLMRQSGVAARVSWVAVTHPRAHALSTGASRRGFLRAAGLGVVAAAAARPFVVPGRAQEDGGRARVHDVLTAYDAQGTHRTGTDVDRASGQWLSARTEAMGVSTRLEPFAVNRLDVRGAYFEIGDRRIQGQPLFDGGLTGPDGIRALLGPSGIHVVTGDAAVAVLRSEGTSLDEVRRKGPARAIVVVQPGSTSGLVVANARVFTEPFGCPVLQLPPDAADALATAERAGDVARLVCDATRSPTTADNVVAEVAGRDRTLAPVVVITPRSGWWRCAAERGGGLACWLETIRAMAEVPPARRVLFLASSGHELGHLGLDAFLHANAPLVAGARAWVHLGANIGAAASGIADGARIQASDDEIDTWMTAALTDAGAPISDHLPRGRVPAGEARNLHVGGGRYVSLLGLSGPWFHHPDDRYPGAVTADAVARYARGVGRCVARLAEA
jgi:hypothetical protein